MRNEKEIHCPEEGEKGACEPSAGSEKQLSSVEWSLKEFLNSVSKTSIDQTHKRNKEPSARPQRQTNADTVNARHTAQTFTVKCASDVSKARQS